MGALNVISPAVGDVAAAAANTTRIQAFLDAGGGELAGSGVVWINDTLKLDDFSKIIVPERMTLKQAPGISKTMISTKSRYAADKVITSLSAVKNLVTATCVGHGYSVGDYVCVNWALPEGYNGVHMVYEVPDANTFKYLAHRAPVSSPATASASVSVYRSGTDINVRKATLSPHVEIKGVLDYDQANNNASNTIDTCAITLTHVAKPFLSATGVIKNARKYGALVICFLGAEIPVLNFNTYSDGLDLNGPGCGANVGLLTGKTGDNLLGVGTANSNGADLPLYPNAMNITEGSLMGLKVGVVQADNAHVDPVRLYGQSAFPIEISIGTITGGCTNCHPLSVLKDTHIHPNGDVAVDRVYVGSITANTDTTGGVVYVSPGAFVKEMDICCDIIAPVNDGNAGWALYNEGTIYNLKDRSVVRAQGQAGAVIFNTATIVSLEMQGDYETTTTVGSVVINQATLQVCDFVSARKGLQQCHAWP